VHFVPPFRECRRKELKLAGEILVNE
jgi:hypothetical protein